MEQQAETNEVLEEFDKAKAEGRQPICPHCQKPLQTEQPQYLSNGCTPDITYNNVKSLKMKTGDCMRVRPNNKTQIIHGSKVPS